jgi:AraC family transcriptional regulator of adaptative response/methylated-DNA-[protein]-cysteine methyltransferase
MSPTADYRNVAKALEFLEENFLDQPSLDDLAAYLGMSKFHLQRLFTRWAGVSPKRFLQFLTLEHAKGLLEESKPLLATAFASGLSGPARLHDLFVNAEGVTPGEYKTGGFDLEIRHGTHVTPFGPALLGTTERGLCHMSFLPSEGPGDKARALAALQKTWPGANLREAPEATGPLARTIFFTSQSPSPPPPLSIFLKGTNFQLKVWNALLRIPEGTVSTYGGLAKALDTPGAARAIGSAVGNNPIAFLIPCHRVIKSMGAFGDYRWGSVRKKAILGWEAARKAS